MLKWPKRIQGNVYLHCVCIGLESPVSVTASVDTSNVPKE